MEKGHHHAQKDMDVLISKLNALEKKVFTFSKQFPSTVVKTILLFMLSFIIIS